MTVIEQARTEKTPANTQIHRITTEADTNLVI